MLPRPELKPWQRRGYPLLLCDNLSDEKQFAQYFYYGKRDLSSTELRRHLDKVNEFLSDMVNSV